MNTHHSQDTLLTVVYIPGADIRLPLHVARPLWDCPPESTHRTGIASTPESKEPPEPADQGAQPCRGICLLLLLLNLMALGNILECSENIQKMLLYSGVLWGESTIVMFKDDVSEVSGNRKWESWGL